MSLYYEDEYVQLHHGDCMDVMAGLPDKSAHLVATDPPYFRKVDADWDNQWGPNVDKFLAWIGEVTDEAVRILADRGTLAMFASPDYVTGVECEIRARATVLNQIVWNKPIGRLGRMNADSMRRFFPTSERIVIAEKKRTPDADLFRFIDTVNHEVARDVYADIREQLVALRDAAGLRNSDVDAALGRNGMAGHYFGASQWSLPTEEAWDIISGLLRRGGVVPPPYGDLRAEFDSRRAEFDSRRAEFDSRRREFDSRRAEFDKAMLSDVWTLPPALGAVRTEHPTQKPTGLMEHIVGTLSRPGDTVLDPFAGSGSTLIAARNLGRKAIGVELEEKYCELIVRRLSQQAFDFSALETEVVE